MAAAPARPGGMLRRCLQDLGRVRTEVRAGFSPRPDLSGRVCSFVMVVAHGVGGGARLSLCSERSVSEPVSEPGAVFHANDLPLFTP